MSDETTPPVPFVVEAVGGGAPPTIGTHLSCSRCQEDQVVGIGYAAMWADNSYLCGPCFLKRVDENGPRIITDLRTPFLGDKEW